MIDNNVNGLASEILAEVKASARRWFIAFCIMVSLEIVTIGGFIWYLTLPENVRNVQIENTEGYANYIGRDLSGGLKNGKD